MCDRLLFNYDFCLGYYVCLNWLYLYVNVLFLEPGLQNHCVGVHCCVIKSRRVKLTSTRFVGCRILWNVINSNGSENIYKNTKLSWKIKRFPQCSQNVIFKIFYIFLFRIEVFISMHRIISIFFILSILFVNEGWQAKEGLIFWTKAKIEYVTISVTLSIF